MYERGIAHRDLKPGNILLKKDPITGRMIVCDSQTVNGGVAFDSRFLVCGVISG